MKVVYAESTDLAIATAVQQQSESWSSDCQERDTKLPLCPGTACTRGSSKRGLEIRIKLWVKMARSPYREDSANSKVLFPHSMV